MIRWQHVCIPMKLVRWIWELEPGPVFHALLHYVVFRYEIRTTYKSQCANCSTVRNNLTVNDDYLICRDCGSRAVSCAPSIWFTEDLIDYSTGIHGEINHVIEKMIENYQRYHKSQPRSDFCRMGWRGEQVYFQFKGGEKVEGNCSRICVQKAAILCPYLWDREFSLSYQDPKTATPSWTPFLATLQSLNSNSEHEFL